MTIQEAIKSGKPFRRPSFSDLGYIVCPTDDDAGLKWESGSQFWARQEDVLATDWEVRKPVKKKVRMLAHFASTGVVVLLREDDKQVTNWTRAPWLDEPK